MNTYYFQGEMNPGNSSSQEVVKSSSPEIIEFVPEFKHIQEDLEGLFNIKVTSESELDSASFKNELYEKVIEDFKAGKPFALDYMFEERVNKKQLLSRKDLQMRGIHEIKPQALEILKHIKGPIGRRMQELMVNAGVLTEEELTTISA